jgi:hypothetical protein
MEERLVRCREKGASITWPLPLDNLLDRLVEISDEFGQPTSRKELAAAIVFAAPRDGDDLAELLLAYRRAQVSDIAPEGVAAENVIDFEVRRPGPRPKKSAGA